ncbi:MAG: N-acetylmuramoyl-L-alanine amidase family protein, partial [Rubricella sp.]
LSLHANTVAEGTIRGAAVYTLSEDASDETAAALADLENSADLFGGEVEPGLDSTLTRVLGDLARIETDARSVILAGAMVDGLRESVGVIPTRPHRSAGFAVLKAPDIPSLLIELGFLSDAEDRAAMLSPEWRERAIAGVIEGLDLWQGRDAALLEGARR